ncbi:MAG: hypothetical protein Q9221_002267 [Calogaya cf. arnoldii]
MQSVAETQKCKEQEVDQNYDPNRRQSDAARTLQRTYRGHRARRELKGLSLSPSARWTEVRDPSGHVSNDVSTRDANESFSDLLKAIKEAKYRDLTIPRPPSRPQTSDSANKPALNRVSSGAQQQWHRAGKIARRAGGDEYSSDENAALSPEDKEARRRARSSQMEERMKTARTMDLAYFLEMVDIHHRYGSHLRKYHAEWKKRPTRDNFFYWLDYGEEKDVSLENCSREKLDSMKIRYLGREERINYAVEVDPQGRLCWKRNGVRVNTNEEWRDSIKGIVKVDDPAPNPSPGLGFYVSSSESSGLSSAEDGDSEESIPIAKRKQPKAAVTSLVETGIKEFANDTKAKILDHRPFKHPSKEPGEKKKKKKAMWIFVADTCYNLYIGIKQSGAFQHSSFLHGGRVSAAGIIKIKDGKLKYMQPRSGHYKPPAASFRAFVHSLQKRGVDMSVMSVPKSYAVLMGIEGYSKGMQTKQKIKEKLGFGEGGDEDKKEGERGEEVSWDNVDSSRPKGGEAGEERVVNGVEDEKPRMEIKLYLEKVQGRQV